MPVDNDKDDKEGEEGVSQTRPSSGATTMKTTMKAAAGAGARLLLQDNPTFHFRDRRLQEVVTMIGDDEDDEDDNEDDNEEEEEEGDHNHHHHHLRTRVWKRINEAGREGRRKTQAAAARSSSWNGLPAVRGTAPFRPPASFQSLPRSLLVFLCP